jgi:membrane protein required for colicin V production
MTAIDLGLCAAAVLSAVIGLYRGLIREMLSLVTWLAAFVAALLLAEHVAQFLFAGVERRTIGLALGFTVVFVGTLFAGAIVQRLIARLIAGTGLTGTDRILGFLFGGARGALAVLIALVAFRPFVSGYGWWQNSALIPWLLHFEQDVLALIAAATEFVSELASGR